MNHPDETRGDDVHALSGAYAVNALDDVERARFEAHLLGCADCREEVAGLREAATMLGSDGAVEPPASVRDAVLAGIETIRPLPPVVNVETRSSDADAERSPATPPSRLADRRLARPLPLLVAAAVVLILGVGALVLRPWAGDDPAPTPHLTAAERVLADGDAARVAKSFPDGAQATVVVSRKEGRAVILTKKMAPAPESRVYQLWLQTPAGEMEPAGLMPDLRNATVLLDGDASRATGVGITVEPDGGSKQPTSEPIAFFTLDS